MTSQHTDVRYLTEVMCLYVGAMCVCVWGGMTSLKDIGALHSAETC